MKKKDKYYVLSLNAIIFQNNVVRAQSNSGVANTYQLVYIQAILPILTNYYPTFREGGMHPLPRHRYEKAAHAKTERYVYMVYFLISLYFFIHNCFRSIA